MSPLGMLIQLYHKKCQCFLFAYKIVNDLATKDYHHYSTSHAHDDSLVAELHHTTWTFVSLKHKCVQIWNKIPEEIKDSFPSEKF